MRDLRRCSGCLGLLALMLLLSPTEARPSNENDIHSVEKGSNIHQHAKRKDVCQKADWFLCRKSVGGGCCPNNYACDTASCYATTPATPPTCNGKPNWYACALTLGPGTCCPVGFDCNDSGGCVPQEGSSPMSCPANFFNCPVSYGGGCCPDGRVCGEGICYNGTPKTLMVSETKTTTNSRGQTTITVVTSQTTITEGPKTTTGPAEAATIPQLIPSTVSKMAAIQTNEGGGGGGGLSPGALGGIVAGVIVILVVIVVAATFIVLRLRKAEKAAKQAEAAAESRRDSSNSQSRSHKAGFGQPSVSEIDSTTDVDPMHQIPIMRPSTRGRSQSGTSVSDVRSPSRTTNFSNPGTSSPPIWGVPFNYLPSEGSDGRQSSLDSYPHHDNNNMRASHTVSIDSHGSRGHSRQTSDTSELEGPHGVSELETDEAEARQRSNSATRPVKGHVRRNSDQNRIRGDSNVATGSLGTVNEIHELHGHYGTWQTVSGQITTRFDRGKPSTPGGRPT